MAWDRTSIRQAIRKHKSHSADLSYNAMSRKDQALVSAAAYHFGSYRKACEFAGIDYGEVSRRPRWTKPVIIRVLKAAYRAGEDLHWSAVSARRDELGRAAFASLQARLFGSWDRALHGAGLDAAEISRYRAWDRSTIVAELRELRADGADLSSGAIQKADPGLHAATLRYFKNYDTAIKAAGISPAKIRRRRTWTPDEVVKELRARLKRKRPLTDSAVRTDHPALYGAALRHFGTLAAARTAATKRAGKA